MVGNMKVIGKTIICMERESILGKMEESTRVNIKMIRKTVMGNTLGLMEENIVVIGKMGNNMEKGNTSYQMVK